MSPLSEHQAPVDGGPLERLQAVSDTALAYLDVDDLLTELLDRVLDAVGADTAAVLLLDDSGSELFARAARGIEEEVRQGVRVPLGVGFAGRIAAERRPVVLDHVDDSTVWNSILWRKGIRAMLGVPLLAAGDVVGVLHVGTLGERIFGPEDVSVLEIAADRIAGALQMRLHEADRAAAEALQRGLLPSAPRRVGDLEFSARYVPAERGGIGGDWYDVFQVGDGSVWIVTGDVAGHGLRAAIVMGRVRSALRAYALLGGGPSDVLALTDRKVQHFELGQMATVVVAVARPPYDELRLALAGHPPPVVAEPHAPPRFADVRPGLPLGVATGRERPEVSVPIAPGSVVVFYTDGLVERRGEPLDAGLERLRAAVAPGPPAQVCQDVMGVMVGNHEPDDDVAMLAMRVVDH